MESSTCINQQARMFLEELDNEKLTSAVFDDSLMCYAHNNKPIGSYECCVKKEEEGALNLITVKASSTTLLGEIHSTSTLKARLLPSLETVSQTKVETTVMSGKVIEKSFSVKLVEDVYDVRVTESVDGEIKSSFKNEIPNSSLSGLITEGADLIFQRILVKSPSSVPLEVIGFDPDYNLATVSYINLGERSIFVGDNELFVKGIQRIVHSKSCLPSSWQNYFMDDGHLILRVQVGSPIIVKANTIPELFKKEEYLPKPIIPQISLNWEDDLELYSRFLDRKGEIKAQYLLYLRDHPEIRDMISDFIKSLLLHKPDEVVKYAVEYFKSFSTRALPSETFPVKIL
uniref:Ciliogenesis-associated TTC17-interacting protein N-terminal domain-containing protein n=1 Tax=Trichobilharzia regenti TaxID=157069 RepID=A0AA85KFC8_TRIRE|nr:unnamed protein product [Trichobilharzia regenti]